MFNRTALKLSLGTTKRVEATKKESKSTFEFSESQQRLVLATFVFIEFLFEVLIFLGLFREELLRMNIDFLLGTVGLQSIEEVCANLAIF